MKAHSAVSSEHRSFRRPCRELLRFVDDRGDAKSPIVYVNKAFTHLSGYSTEEALGKSPGFLQGYGTDASVLQRLHADMAAGRVFEGKAVNYRKDGSDFTMWWRVFR